MKIKTIIVILISFVTTIAVGFFVMQYFNLIPSNLKQGVPSYMESVVDLANEKKYQESFDIALEILKSEDLSYEQELSLLTELTAITVSAHNSQIPFESNVATLYEVFFGFTYDESKPDYYRASVVGMVDRLFWETSFNTTPFITALQQTDYKFSEPYKDKSKYEQTYRSLYDLNEYAYELMPDKFIAGFQAWNVGNSVLESPPPEELETEFADYVTNQLQTYEEAEYLLFQPDFQRQWLDETLQTIKERLNTMYPDLYNV